MKMSMCVKTSPPPHTYTYTVGPDFCEATRWKEASVQRNHCDKTRYVQEEALIQGRKCHPCWGKSVKTSKWTGNLVTIRKDDEDYSQGTEVRLRRKYITYKARKIRNCRMCINSTESSMTRTEITRSDTPRPACSINAVSGPQGDSGDL